jgi:hypothetical protein
MPKVRWTEARWAKRAQKARALAKNTRVQVRRRMMLEVAEFYDRLAKLTRDFKTQGRGSRRRAAGTQQGERSRGASAYRWKAECTVDRIQEVGGRAADCGAPTGKATRLLSVRHASACVNAIGASGVAANDPGPQRSRSKEFSA